MVQIDNKDLEKILVATRLNTDQVTKRLCILHMDASASISRHFQLKIDAVM
ncbi:hypothetical protein [Nitrosomonas aestuarii]|uniref:hypothetical protein n=1 Tax=Nitrosomonas aestuarii TaxID=52441 RepID=UPI0014816735|nr:hypothetical protein [Nitrosomonas aestuarii]